MKLLIVPNDRASAEIPHLFTLDLVDRGAKIAKGDGHVLVPLRDDRWEDALPFGEVVEGFAHVRDNRSPQQRILDDLDVPEHLIPLLPMRWEFVGDIAILKMPPDLDDWKYQIGRAYAEALGVSTVCVDRGGVHGEFRQPNMMLIHGENTESVRLENGIRYLFDVRKVMFASGNVDERERMGRLDCHGETVLDMFAGIGYFTLPIAKFSGAGKVVACEKNPESYHYLVKNVELNQVSHVVDTVLGDNRDLPDHPFAHRILMGYVHRTREFLPKALRLLLPGGIVHYHENYYVRDAMRMLRDDLDKGCDGRPYEIIGMREVKSYAPSVSHYVADIRFH